MPIDRDLFQEHSPKRVKYAVLEIIKDGQGYTVEELVDTVKCSESSIRSVLTYMQSVNIAESTTIPSEGTKNIKYYAITDRAKNRLSDYQKEDRPMKRFFQEAESPLGLAT